MSRIRSRHAPIREESALLELAGRRLVCRIRRSATRRSLALRVNAQGEVVVNAPDVLCRARIEAFIRRHAGWVQKRLEAMPRPWVWQSGMLLPYLGSALTLVWQERSPGRPCRIEAGALWACAPREELPRRIEAAYRALARPLFEARLAEYAARLGAPVPPLRLSGARTRWGSLSASGVVRMNWRLLQAPLELIDYVVCHELAHLRVRDHSPAFWREVAALYPGYAAARERLRALGPALFAF